MTEVTIIRLATPMDKPNIAKMVVKENIPPFLDLKYLYPKLKEIEDTILFH